MVEGTAIQVFALEGTYVKMHDGDRSACITYSRLCTVIMQATFKTPQYSMHKWWLFGLSLLACQV